MFFSKGMSNVYTTLVIFVGLLVVMLITSVYIPFNLINSSIVYTTSPDNLNCTMANNTDQQIMSVYIFYSIVAVLATGGLITSIIGLIVEPVGFQLYMLSLLLMAGIIGISSILAVKSSNLPKLVSQYCDENVGQVTSFEVKYNGSGYNNGEEYDVTNNNDGDESEGLTVRKVPDSDSDNDNVYCNDDVNCFEIVDGGTNYYEGQYVTVSGGDNGTGLMITGVNIITT